MAIIYRPVHQSQISDPDTDDRYDRYNCLAECTAMAGDFATLGGMRIGGELVRALSNEPVPDPKSPGLNLPQILAVAPKLHFALFDATGWTFDNVVARINVRQGAIILGIRAALVSLQSCYRYNLGHAVFVGASRQGGDLLVFDTLCSAPHWVPSSEVRSFARLYAIANRMPSTQVVAALTRQIPLIAG